MEPIIVIGVITVIAMFAVAFIGASLQERFATGREERAERQRLDQEARDRARARQLKAISDTRRHSSALLTRLVADLFGDEHAHEIAVGDHDYPDTDPLLIDDVDVLREFIDLVTEFANRPALSGTAQDQARASAVQVAIKLRLDAQVARVERGQEPVRLDAALLGPDLQQAEARMRGREAPGNR